MLTTDLALRVDPAYEKISRRFHENPDEFADAFARAWFKLTHRDMGPIQRYLGPEVPSETLIWQDPVPAGTASSIDADVAALKEQILASGLTRRASSSRSRGPRPRRSAAATSAAAPTAPASAWSRSARWEVNNPAQLAKVLSTLEEIQAGFGKARSRWPT